MVSLIAVPRQYTLSILQAGQFLGSPSLTPLSGATMAI